MKDNSEVVMNDVSFDLLKTVSPWRVHLKENQTFNSSDEKLSSQTNVMNKKSTSFPQHQYMRKYPIRQMPHVIGNYSSYEKMFKSTNDIIDLRNNIILDKLFNKSKRPIISPSNTNWNILFMW